MDAETAWTADYIRQTVGGHVLPAEFQAPIDWREIASKLAVALTTAKRHHWDCHVMECDGIGCSIPAERACTCGQDKREEALKLYQAATSGAT